MSDKEGVEEVETTTLRNDPDVKALLEAVKEFSEDAKGLREAVDTRDELSKFTLGSRLPWLEEGITTLGKKMKEIEEKQEEKDISELIAIVASFLEEIKEYKTPLSEKNNIAYFSGYTWQIPTFKWIAKEEEINTIELLLEKVKLKIGAFAGKDTAETVQTYDPLEQEMQALKKEMLEIYDDTGYINTRTLLELREIKNLMISLGKIKVENPNDDTERSEKNSKRSFNPINLFSKGFGRSSRKKTNQPAESGGVSQPTDDTELSAGSTVSVSSFLSKFSSRRTPSKPKSFEPKRKLSNKSLGGLTI